MKQIPFIEVSGGDFECGRTVGAALRADVCANVAAYMEVFTQGIGIDPSEVRRYAETLVPVVGAYAPELLEEMRGIAAGSGLDLLDVLALNARTEILYGLQAGRPPSGAGLGDECTSAGVLPSATLHRHTLIGQNWDWKDMVADRTAVLGISKPGRPRVLVFTEAGFVGKIGMNEYGIGVLANLLVSRDDQGQAGVPYHVLLRKVLDARHLHAAISAVTQASRGASGNFLIGCAGGEVIDIEATPAGFDYLLTEDGIVTHSNHFLSPELRARDLRRGQSALSMIRYDRARRLLAAEAGRITPDSFIRTFRDHLGYPYSICRHVSPEDPPFDRVRTGASIIMDLEDGAVWVAAGPPCESEYRRLEVRALAAVS